MWTLWALVCAVMGTGTERDFGRQGLKECSTHRGELPPIVRKNECCLLAKALRRRGTECSVLEPFGSAEAREVVGQLRCAWSHWSSWSLLYFSLQSFP